MIEIGEDDAREAGRHAAATMLGLARATFADEASFLAFCKGALEAGAATLSFHSSAPAAADFCGLLGMAVQQVDEERRAAMN